MPSPTVDKIFNDLVAIHNTAAIGLRDLGRVRGPYNILTEDDLRKFALTTSMAILGRLPCLRLGDDAIDAMNSKYSHLLAENMGAA